MARGTFALCRNIIFYSLRKLNGKFSYNGVQERSALTVDILNTKLVACYILVPLVFNFSMVIAAKSCND